MTILAIKIILAVLAAIGAGLVLGAIAALLLHWADVSAGFEREDDEVKQRNRREPRRSSGKIV